MHFPVIIVMKCFGESRHYVQRAVLQHFAASARGVRILRRTPHYFGRANISWTFSGRQFFPDFVEETIFAIETRFNQPISLHDTTYRTFFHLLRSHPLGRLPQQAVATGLLFMLSALERSEAVRAFSHPAFREGVETMLHAEDAGLVGRDFLDGTWLVIMDTMNQRLQKLLMAEEDWEYWERSGIALELVSFDAPLVLPDVPVLSFRGGVPVSPEVLRVGRETGDTLLFPVTPERMLAMFWKKLGVPLENPEKLVSYFIRQAVFSVVLPPTPDKQWDATYRRMAWQLPPLQWEAQSSVEEAEWGVSYILERANAAQRSASFPRDWARLHLRQQK